MDKKYSVVIVDDEIWALRGLKGIADWDSLGFQVIGEFTDSDEALSFILKERPDLIFTDIRMPGIDGMSLIETIKKEGLDSFIVIVTAYKDFEIAQKALKNKVDDYIIKPLDKKEVRETLGKLYLSLSHRDEEEFDLAKCDLSIKKNRQLPAVRNFLISLENEGGCKLIVSDHELNDPNGNIIPIFLPHFNYAYITCEDKNTEVWLFKYENVGMSRFYKTCDSFDEMIHDATISYDGNFTFSGNTQIGKIQEYIYENMEKKLNMDDLANAFFLSKPYIFELFRNNTDTSAMNFLKHVRLSKAAKLLKTSELSVREIAASVGFDDAGYFGKVFKTTYGCTPEQYAAN